MCSIYDYLLKTVLKNSYNQTIQYKIKPSVFRFCIVKGSVNYNCDVTLQPNVTVWYNDEIVNIQSTLTISPNKKIRLNIGKTTTSFDIDEINYIAQIEDVPNDTLNNVLYINTPI